MKARLHFEARQRTPNLGPLGLFPVIFALMAILGCTGDGRTPDPSSPPSQASADWAIRTRVQGAWQYLTTEMDRWSKGTVIYDDYACGASAFYPSNWSGDSEALTLDPNCRDDPATGGSCIRITYAPKLTSRQGFAEIIWVYPDHPGGNWGFGSGRRLSGATRLQLRARGAAGGEVLAISVGGMNRAPWHNQKFPAQDSIDRTTRTITLGKKWTTSYIPLPKRANLGKVIAGFRIHFNRTDFPRGCTVYLDDITYDNPNSGGLRLIRSYTPTSDPRDHPIRNSAFLYDNDLALLACLSRKDAEGDRRAKILADSIVWAQMHDRTYKRGNGLWRNAYSCGPLDDPATNTARLPGRHDGTKMLEDRYAVSSDTGNIAWTIIALLSAHERLEAGKGVDCPYLRASRRAAEWIEGNCRVEDALGGYSGGFEGWEKTERNPVKPKKLQWRSTEHCIDVYVAFLRLAASLRKEGLDGAMNWEKRALHARKFVLSMWNSHGRHFWMGVRDARGKINRDAIPLDAQTWALLALGHDGEFRRTVGWPGPPGEPSFLAWVEKNCRLHVRSHDGYLFSNNGKGIWPEGCAQLAAAYHYLGQPARGQAILGDIISLKPLTALPSGSVPSARHAIQAAWPHVAETGIVKEFAPGVVGMWSYPARPHLGATAWFIMAATGKNPYWLDGPPLAIP